MTRETSQPSTMKPPGHFTLMEDYLSGLLRGERAAFDAYYLTHAPVLLGMMLQQGVPGPDAEDMVLETLALCCRLIARGRFQNRHRWSLGAWTKQVCRVLLRRRRSRKAGYEKALGEYALMLAEASVITDLDEDEAAAGGEAEPVVAEPMLVPLVQEALAQLSAEDRRIIQLSYFEQQKDAATAAILGLKPAAFRKRKQRARDRFKVLLEKDVRVPDRLIPGRSTTQPNT